MEPSLASEGVGRSQVSFPLSTGGSAGTVIKEMFNNNPQNHNHASFNSAVLLREGCVYQETHSLPWVDNGKQLTASVRSSHG